MNKLTIESFYGWLEQFEPMDLATAADEIYMLYVDQAAQTSTAKKKESTPSEK